MGSPPPVWAARVPEPCVPPAWRYPAPSAPLAGAPPASGPPPGSFRPHARTPAGSARIVPLWLSCSPKPSFLLGLEARNKVHGLWFTGGARSEHRKGPIQSSELTSSSSTPRRRKSLDLNDLYVRIRCSDTFSLPPRRPEGKVSRSAAQAARRHRRLERPCPPP